MNIALVEIDIYIVKNEKVFLCFLVHLDFGVRKFYCDIFYTLILSCRFSLLRIFLMEILLYFNILFILIHDYPVWFYFYALQFLIFIKLVHFHLMLKI